MDNMKRLGNFVLIELFFISIQFVDWFCQLTHFLYAILFLIEVAGNIDISFFYC